MARSTERSGGARVAEGLRPRLIDGAPSASGGMPGARDGVLRSRVYQGALAASSTRRAWSRASTASRSSTLARAGRPVARPRVAGSWTRPLEARRAASHASVSRRPVRGRWQGPRSPAAASVRRPAVAWTSARPRRAPSSSAERLRAIPYAASASATRPCRPRTPPSSSRAGRDPGRSTRRPGKPTRQRQGAHGVRRRDRVAARPCIARRGPAHERSIVLRVVIQPAASLGGRPRLSSAGRIAQQLHEEALLDVEPVLRLAGRPGCAGRP
jgi:hypothetical protein